MTETIQLVIGIELLGVSLFLLICAGVQVLVQTYYIIKDRINKDTL